MSTRPFFREVVPDKTAFLPYLTFDGYVRAAFATQKRHTRVVMLCEWKYRPGSIPAPAVFVSLFLSFLDRHNRYSRRFTLIRRKAHYFPSCSSKNER